MLDLEYLQMCACCHFRLFESLPGSSVHGRNGQARYWSGLSSPPLRGHPDAGTEPASLMAPALAGRFFNMSTTGGVHLKMHYILRMFYFLFAEYFYLVWRGIEFNQLLFCIHCNENLFSFTLLMGWFPLTDFLILIQFCIPQLYCIIQCMYHETWYVYILKDFCVYVNELYWIFLLTSIYVIIVCKIFAYTYKC